MPESVHYLPASSGISTTRRRRLRRQSGERPERYLTTLAMTAAATGTLALWIGGHAALTVTGYHLGRAQSELAAVEQSNRVLSARAAVLADSGRVIAAAESSSMTRAVPAQTFYIRGGAASAAVQAGASRPATTTIAMAVVRHD